MEHHIVDGRTMTSLYSRSPPLDEIPKPGIREAQCLFIDNFNGRIQSRARDCDLLQPRLSSGRQGGQQEQARNENPSRPVILHRQPPG
jgi:hypothetical protein